MLIHLYHFQLLRCLIRRKIKGDHRIRLTCADRKELVENKEVAISENHIVKVLNEAGKERLNLSQHVLNQLSAYSTQEDWNAFLRANPLPTELTDPCCSTKCKKRVEELVAQRIQKLEGENP